MMVTLLWAMSTAVWLSMNFLIIIAATAKGCSQPFRKLANNDIRLVVKEFPFRPIITHRGKAGAAQKQRKFAFHRK